MAALAIKHSFYLHNDASGVPTKLSGEAANLKIRYSGDAYAADLPLTITEIGTTGEYLISGFGDTGVSSYYVDCKLYKSGVEQTAFGVRDLGDPTERFLDKIITTEQDVLSIVDFNNASGLKTDVIAEHTGDTGVTVDGLLIKDNRIRGSAPITCNQIEEFTVGNGVIIDSVLIKDDIYTGHTGRALLAEANQIIVDSKRAADLAGYVYNDLDTAVTYAASLASVNNRQNIYIVPHIGSYYTISVSIPDYVNIYGLGGMVIVRGTFARSGSVALSSRLQNIYFESYDINDAIVRTIAINCVWQTLVDALDGGIISVTSSHLTNCGLFGTYADVGDDITSGGTNKIVGCYGNFNVTWQSSDEMYGYDYIVGDTFTY